MDNQEVIVESDALGTVSKLNGTFVSIGENTELHQVVGKTIKKQGNNIRETHGDFIPEEIALEKLRKDIAANKAAVKDSKQDYNYAADMADDAVSINSSKFKEKKNNELQGLQQKQEEIDHKLAATDEKLDKILSMLGNNTESRVSEKVVTRKKVQNKNNQQQKKAVEVIKLDDKDGWYNDDDINPPPPELPKDLS